MRNALTNAVSPPHSSSLLTALNIECFLLLVHLHHPVCINFHLIENSPDLGRQFARFTTEFENSEVESYLDAYIEDSGMLIESVELLDRLSFIRASHRLPSRLICILFSSLKRKNERLKGLRIHYFPPTSCWHIDDKSPMYIPAPIDIAVMCPGSAIPRVINLVFLSVGIKLVDLIVVCAWRYPIYVFDGWPEPG